MYSFLIIDDDENIRENIQEIFELTGYNVFTAATGWEGIKLASKIKPSLILCDIAMPGLNGYEVKQKLTQNKETLSIPFIYLTALADIDSMRKGMNLGADDYIIKPVRANELISIVNKRLTRINELKLISNSGKVDSKLSMNEKISLSTGKEHIFIILNHIVAILVMGDYTRVFTNEEKKLIVKRTLKDWENTLPGKYFVRVHRNMIINLNYVEKIEPWFNGKLIAKIKHYPETVKFSKRYSQLFKKKLKKG